MTDNYSREELLEAHRLRTDFPYFCRLLKIKTKKGKVKSFTLKKAQLQLWKTIKKQIDNDLPVRIIILKARQLGMSTFVQAYLLWRAITQPGTNGLVVAHLEDAASELFSKVEMMYRLLPKPLFDELEKVKDTSKKGKKLAFGGDLNTLLYVDTANNAALGRGMTFQHVHLSEMAFYTKPEEIMFGLSQSVPNLPGTTIIIESTANGLGNYFHSQWERASDSNKNTSFEAAFFPWFGDKDYQRELRKTDSPLLKEERLIKRKYNLTTEQMMWRRDAIEDGCDGDEDKFKQENPSDPIEAFLISGKPYFNQKALISYKEYADKKVPLRTGSIQVQDGKAPEFVDWDEGPWRVYMKPVKGRSYVIGADIAGGTARDFSSACILDTQTLEQVASYRGKLDPDEFARELNWMGRSYNNALLAPEKNSEGRATVLKLQKLMYPNLFFHQHEDSWSGGVQQSWGWTTSSKTRPTMLAQLSEQIRKKHLIINDERTVRELMNFVRVDTSKLAEAAQGAWDDMVISLAIATSSEVRGQGNAMHEFFHDEEHEPGISTVTNY